MSFSSRLRTFFVLMVLVPIIGIGVLGFRLIQATESGRAGSRASGLLTAASAEYADDEMTARRDARTVVGLLEHRPPARIRRTIAADAAAAGFQRIQVRLDGRVIADTGSPTAVAPGTAVLTRGASRLAVTVSVTGAAQFANAISGPFAAMTVTEGGRLLASTLPAGAPAPPGATVHVGRDTYAVSRISRFDGFGPAPVELAALSDTRASAQSVTNTAWVALAFLAGLALLAFGFASVASRGVNAMLKRFLTAATRLADRDFSAPVPVEGADEFARLATEFNRMSDQLKEYIVRLDDERARLREAIRRTGETFASSRDREQLEALTLETALSGLEGGFGRLTRRDEEDEPLAVVQAMGDWAPAGELIVAAERLALNGAGYGEAAAGDLHVMAARMGETPRRRLAHGTLTVGRRGAPFSDADKDLFRSLAVQAWRALDNVRLHDEADRKAITDLLTGLVNHGHFQAVLARELEAARRYAFPVGLILIDLDDFKQVNDTYGHPQGDAVLRAVARVLTQHSRDIDTAARYGGEELALILSHTDLHGAASIAERVRHVIEALEVPFLDGRDGALRITASIGVAAATEGPREALIAEADAALYEAKRGGKNRVVRGGRAAAA